MQKINLIFPCYNPPIAWKDIFILKCNRLISNNLDCDFHFFIVDDGSQSRISLDEVRFLKTSVPNLTVLHHSSNQGKGQAIRTGVSAIESGMIMYTDLDFPFGTLPFKTAIESLINHSDVVIGKRDQTYHKRLPYMRRIISKMYQSLNTIIIPKELSGCQAGFMGFNESVKPLFLSTQINRFLFATEFASIIHKHGVKYKCIDLSLRDLDPHTTINKKSLWQEFSNLLYLLTRLKFLKY